MAKNYTPTPRAKEMFLVIEKYLSGNLSRKEFCQQQGIRCSILKWWIDKYRQVNGISKHSIIEEIYPH